MNEIEKMLIEAYEEMELELMNESYDEFINEAAKRRTLAEYKAEAEKKLKDQIAKYTELIKTKPERADFYKAQMDLVNAKIVVLKMKERVEQVRKKL